MTDLLANNPNIHSAITDRLKNILVDKRGDQKAVPIDLGRYLSESQLLALHSLESFGWQLFFVRRPLSASSIVVVKNESPNQYAVLEDDGSVNLNPSILLRH